MNFKYIKPKQKTKPLLEKLKLSNNAKTGLIIFAGTISAYLYTIYLTKSNNKKQSINPIEQNLIIEDKSINVFDKIAKEYDRKINMDEFLMFIPLLRKSGDVMEISCGTGRNTKYYLNKVNEINSVMFVDQSEKMIEQIKSKKEIADLENHFNLNNKLSEKYNYGTYKTIEFKKIDLHDFNSELKYKFDVIIDTFGICSFQNPQAVISNIKKYLKDGGKIVFLEHGRSKYGFINDYLDKYNDQRSLKWGCNWNRDILSIIKEAGLKVEYTNRYHFGTTYYIVASA